jgi:hypothetical protein
LGVSGHFVAYGDRIVIISASQRGGHFPGSLSGGHREHEHRYDHFLRRLGKPHRRDFQLLITTCYGRAFFQRYGRYLLLSPKALKKADRFF